MGTNLGVLCVERNALHYCEVDQRERKGKRLESAGEQSKEEQWFKGRALHQMAPAVTAGHQLSGVATKTTGVDLTFLSMREDCERVGEWEVKAFYAASALLRPRPTARNLNTGQYLASYFL